jgi:hypothetical protein
VGLADIGIDQGHRPAPGQVSDEGIHEGGLARIGSAEQQELALAKRTRVHHPVCYHVSPILNHVFSPHERDGGLLIRRSLRSSYYHRAKGRNNEMENPATDLRRSILGLFVRHALRVSMG